MSKILAVEKTHIAELQGLTLEKEQLSERLENASMRYLLAEKKLDRARSAQVAKLEAQAISGSRGDSNNANGDAVTNMEGVAYTDGNVEDGWSGAASDIARQEAVAVAEIRAEQVQRLAEENKKLTGDLTVAQSKLASLTEEDYANSELFKTLKSQHVDVIKRINDLEATNINLRAEAKQLQAERTAYREETDNELRTATIEMESQLARTEADLARVRHARDELVADLGVKKATQDQLYLSSDHVKELASAQESRISVLESEIARLRSQAAHVETNFDDEQAETEAFSPATLQSKLNGLEKEKTMLESELTSMELAWKKALAAANKKIAEAGEIEERINRIAAEKAKADQKYFGAMKAKETREVEIRTLRTQNAKSSEIVSQLKDAESSCRTLLVNLEKQLAEVRDALNGVTNQHRAALHNLSEQKSSSERLASQLIELKKTLNDRDVSAHGTAQVHRQSEVEIAELKVRMEGMQKSLESWKKKALGNQSEEQESLRVSNACILHLDIIPADKKHNRL